jgi:hypothetical protein
MPLSPIIDLVKNRLPFATDIDAKINSFTTEAFYFFKPYLLKTVLNVEVEASYTPLETMMIADYVAWQLLVRKAVETSGGTTSGGSGSGAKQLKKAKADVVETEFGYATANDGSAIMLDTTKLIADLLLSICNKAKAINLDQGLSIQLDFCVCEVYDTIPPFIVKC